MKLWQALILFGMLALVLGAILISVIPEPPRGLAFGLGLAATLLAWRVSRVKN